MKSWNHRKVSCFNYIKINSWNLIYKKYFECLIIWPIHQFPFRIYGAQWGLEWVGFVMSKVCKYFPTIVGESRPQSPDFEPAEYFPSGKKDILEHGINRIRCHYFKKNSSANIIKVELSADGLECKPVYMWERCGGLGTRVGAGTEVHVLLLCQVWYCFRLRAVVDLKWGQNLI